MEIRGTNGGLGALLQRARVERGVSQSALARRTGVPQPAISRFENGRETPSLERFGRLIAGLGLRPDLALAPLAVYGKIVNAHAEWHWASEIMQKHIHPSLHAALKDGAHVEAGRRNLAPQLAGWGT